MIKTLIFEDLLATFYMAYQKICCFCTKIQCCMKRGKIIGREREMTELQRSMDSDRSEFVIVYGRRRVGKTYLVDNFFNYEYDFSYVEGHRLSKQKQLRNFAKAMKKYAQLPRQPNRWHSLLLQFAECEREPRAEC